MPTYADFLRDIAKRIDSLFSSNVSRQKPIGSKDANALRTIADYIEELEFEKKVREGMR